VSASFPLLVHVVRFQDNLSKVQQLLTFDQVILNFVLTKLQPIADHQRTLKYVPPDLNLKTVYDVIRTVQKNDSLRAQYREIYNQGLVLAVSHFTSATRELFKAVVVRLLTHGHAPKKLQQLKLDLPVGQLVQKSGDIPDYVASQLVAHSDMSFQDMQSINRGYRDFCGYDPPRDNHVNNIVIGQAFRHAIVHNAAVVDEQLVNQVSAVKPRDLRDTVEIGSQILMTPQEVDLIGKSMLQFLRVIAMKFPAQPVENRT